MYYGDYRLGKTIYIPFNTFDSNDPQASVTVTNLANTDVHIHRDDNTTQRNNAAGVTVNINFDSITGNHLIVIDTNDDTVQGFWQTGHDYEVRLEGITVDAATLNIWIASFSIENRYHPTSETPTHSVTSDWELNEQFKLSGLGIITTLSEDTGKNPIFQWELDELSTAGMVSTDRPRHGVNLNSISNDYDSANNAELDYDGTGYNKSNSTIGTCTTNTDMRGTDSAYTGTPPTAAAIVNEWESQSQADPTGFHVNVLEVNGTAQTAGDIAALIAALNDLSAAEVNAEVVDALATDTYAEPGQGAPAATATLAAKINYLYKAWRNKKDNDGTTTNLYADDATTVDQKQTTSSSGGTVTKGEWASGP